MTNKPFLTVNNNPNMTGRLLVVIITVAIISCITVALSTALVMNTVYGIDFGSPEYKQYFNNDGTEAPFEANLMINACIYVETPNMMIFDSRGLKDTIFDQNDLFSDRHHNDLDPCKAVADKFLNDDPSWILKDIDRSDGETVITLVK